jgi:hypothetical protein
VLKEKDRQFMILHALKIIAKGDFKVCKNRKFKVTGTGNDFFTRGPVLKRKANQNLAREPVKINLIKFLHRLVFLK